jgi:Uma2 family endonuclease
MNVPIQISPPEAVMYPEDDGLPMADNTLQYEYMVTVKGGLDALFAHDNNVFIAGNLLWYPVEGNNTICLAPDVLAAFGRPKGRRGSYRQWEEGGIAPQVVFEILSQSHRLNEAIRKFLFYQRYGVDEYYVYDPDTGDRYGYLRQGDELVEIAEMEGWRSPRLGVRFQRSGTALELYRPDGRKFVSYVELAEAEEKERQEKERLQRIADEERQRVDRLRAQLKAHGIDPDA